MRVSYNEKNMKAIVNALPDCCDSVFDMSPHIGSIAWFYSVKKGKKISKANSSIFIDFADGVVASCIACKKDYEVFLNNDTKKYESREY